MSEKFETQPASSIESKPTSQDQIKPPEISEEKNTGLAYSIGSILEQSDSMVYAFVGFCFVLGAILALGYTFWSFSSSVGEILNYKPAAVEVKPGEIPPIDERPGLLASTIIALVSDLLLVLIIMEVLSTVIEYLKAHVTSLTPFLSIGIISATRGVLSIGARLSVKQVHGEEFNNSMIELGVNAFAIFALGLTLTLLNRTGDNNTMRHI